MHYRKANIVELYDLFGGKDIGAGMTGTVRKVQHRVTGSWFGATALAPALRHRAPLARVLTWGPRAAAVKTIFLNRVDDELLAQLRSEIKFLAKLDHPNICKLHEVFETSLCVYLVMELLEGGELFDRLKRVKRFPEDDARRMARDMFAAVRYMHSKGICHRDLKCACERGGERPSHSTDSAASLPCAGWRILCLWTGGRTRR